MYFYLYIIPVKNKSIVFYIVLGTSTVYTRSSSYRMAVSHLVFSAGIEPPSAYTVYEGGGLRYPCK